ncbi:MAG TPA: Gfo/Idh/MocA family oxidoreductase [Anaerolineales bacterium]|nr:Gfo/Idh/MocA family oxidoreductase [Anaerolineales bacterium]
MNTHGIGIIGSGNNARAHMMAVLANRKARLAAICTDNLDQGIAVAAELGIQCNIYTDLDQMLSDAEVQTVFVCTPNNLHAQQATQAARAKKNILIEKPVALNLTELHELHAAVKESGVKTQVSFVLRWNPYMRIAKKLIDEGSLGRPFMVETNYWHSTPRAAPGHWMTTKSVAGSVFLMGGCHALDAARWLVGSDIVEVSAFGTQGIGKEWYEYPHTVEALVRFEGGVIGRVSASMGCIMPYAFNVTVMGDRGTLRDNQLWSHEFSGQTDYVTIPTQMPDSGSVLDHPFSGGLEHLLACIEEDREPSISLSSTMNVHEALLAIDRSVEEGKPVTLPLLEY